MLAAGVLVVEDDRPTRELLGTILEGEHIACRLASNGHEAMELAHHLPPDLVVLDLHLPSVQGEAVGTALRIEFGPALPILAMSASSEQALADRIGAYAFVSKPFEVDDFVRQVRRGLVLSARSDVLRQESDDARERLREAIERQRPSMEQVRERRFHAPHDRASGADPLAAL